ncbi:MAG: acyl-[acyl-carrier-protein]--UDP-N-acetylglucosamine O-acyltransferase [Candidatus Lambdaproteobacteria bacterium RIFOXYD1_FULL_56_27]|uniref:Acyl-[acyl-carrier-protein]--UDP-N-acetylglucosamine O-acyltransferase n=1 Tax=Candidatus Lambdaproteobacteria bacterium RIFOXYD2_FULL_56_26 TaxID=1817773 RepID=A0A1F6GVP5_9PROT|nr:MAG: acyl-[acyl-carrier-protein]--UDP-N-acetylglucosamine O-acyltransferase [Candidatus Lambdaproteobacteria bacterium RIFOXYD2_FULL_56_26]OGH03749.1 MAG: acyl-[acyl-carrier-protein]--UDP-N-acetylglucosamine O-acyltransferase [Candidatus Lambdaproteobacteria bacterium RIFOXYC1_FULL_56_13]OGH07333.1 MAG: acyl-[acyl-carrier-protein]--UDP-N-acetylglucosamine O-acyltransferase [Candidatus Lambdaproteobacteria bacterium RIFOXYD1_FULL_56_27]
MIHPTAIIDKSAKIHERVQIGAYTTVGPEVEIFADCEIKAHVAIEGPTQIGPRCRIFPFAAIGLEPQDKKYHGENSLLVIGSDNLFREYVTLNRGSEAGGGVTKIGDHNWIMAYCHIAHDCQIGSHTVLANGTTLGGHVEVGDYAVLGGLTAVHQFCRIGKYALTGGQSMIAQDAAPYMIVAGNRAKAAGLNFVGLERNGFSKADIEEINQIYRIFFLSGLAKDPAIEKLRAERPAGPNLDLFINFINNSQRGVIR